MAPLPIISDAQAPALLGFASPRAFREAVYRQRIPFRRVGRRILVRVEDLVPNAETVEQRAEPRVDVERDEPITAAEMLAALGFE